VEIANKRALVKDPLELEKMLAQFKFIGGSTPWSALTCQRFPRLIAGLLSG
jgi:hypothetical protein